MIDDNFFDDIDTEKLIFLLTEEAGYEDDIAVHIAQYMSELSERNKQFIDLVERSKIEKKRYKKSLITCLKNRIIEGLIKNKNSSLRPCISSALKAIEAFKNINKDDEIRKNILYRLNKEVDKFIRNEKRKAARLRERNEIIKIFETKYPQLNPKALDVLLIRGKIGTTKEDIKVIEDFLEVLTNQ